MTTRIRIEVPSDQQHSKGVKVTEYCVSYTGDKKEVRSYTIPAGTDLSFYIHSGNMFEIEEIPHD